MTSTFESLLTIPPFTAGVSDALARKNTRPGHFHPLFRSQERAATWHDLPFWPVLTFGWVAVLISFFSSLR